MNFVANKIAQIINLVRHGGYIVPDHAIAIASELLDVRPLPPEFSRMGPALIRQAAVFNPQNRDTLRLAAAINEQTNNPPFGAWLGRAMDLTQADPVPDNIASPDPQSACAEELLDYIENQQANDLRLPALLLLWQRGERDALVKSIEIMAASRSGLLAAPIMAWAAYSVREPLLARMLLDEGVSNFLGLNLRARFALKDGKIADAITQLKASLDHEPFQPGTIETLADLTQTGSLPSPGPDVHICLYTWNKPDLLASTMASLATTDLGQARVTILNNGTTICPPEELENRIRKAAPNLTIQWIHLPVNIGAPAARNWLLAMDEVRQARYVAFLDDDVLLPAHWLSRYIATLRRFSDACAVGPKCVNDNVRTIQYAFRLFREVGPDKIRFTPNAPTLLDMGQFDAARPSLTVMGCCHLFDMDRMNKLGVPNFDIGFSPSQVDDIEHDLQIWKMGGQVIYDGRVPVVHLQDTGKTQTRASIGQAYANHFKMEHKFTPDELQAMDHATREADQNHFRLALEAVMPMLTGPAANFWRITGEHLL